MPKGPKIQKSDVVIECTPDTDVEFTWPEVSKAIQAVDLSGVQWAPDFVEQDLCFGMKKLVVVCQITDSKVPTTTVITEALSKIHGVGAAEMISIETAGQDWEKQDKKDEKKSGKKKKKKGKKAAVRVVTEEMMKKDATKICVAIKEATYYVTGCQETDGSAQTDVTKENLEAIMTQVRAKNTECALMIIAAGSTTVSVLADLPEEKAAACNASDWVKASGVNGVEGDAKRAFGTFVCDAEKDEFPIKQKDMFSANAFAALKKLGVLEDESDDEIYIAEDEDADY